MHLKTVFCVCLLSLLTISPLLSSGKEEAVTDAPAKATLRYQDPTFDELLAVTSPNKSHVGEEQPSTNFSYSTSVFLMLDNAARIGEGEGDDGELQRHFLAHFPGYEKFLLLQELKLEPFANIYLRFSNVPNVTVLHGTLKSALSSFARDIKYLAFDGTNTVDIIPSMQRTIPPTQKISFSFLSVLCQYFSALEELKITKAYITGKKSLAPLLQLPLDKLTFSSVALSQEAMVYLPSVTGLTELIFNNSTLPDDLDIFEKILRIELLKKVDLSYCSHTPAQKDLVMRIKEERAGHTEFILAGWEDADSYYSLCDFRG